MTRGPVGRIPVLDIGAYLAGEPGAAAPLARAIARTCEDTGFLVVQGHGVPQALPDRVFAVAAQFFARPEAEKLPYKIGELNIGYLPFGGQTVRHSPVNQNTRPNFSESFYISRDRAPDHPDIVGKKRLIGLNRWPADMPEFRAATTAYYAAMEAMTTRLVPVFATGARPAGRIISPSLCRAELTIRLIHYPPQPDPGDNEFGFAPHTDNNFITFLAQSALPGLEVRPKRASGSGRRRSPAPLSSTPARCWRAIERPLQRDAAPGHQPQRPLALRDPVLPRPQPRQPRRPGPDLHRPRQPAALRADHLRRLHRAPPDPKLRPSARRRRLFRAEHFGL